MNKKFILGIAAAAALAVGSLSVSAEGFAKTNTYTPGMFSDVPATEWYASSVSSSYELGFMKGTADGVFSPEGNMTVAEAVTIAARVHDAYNAKGTTFSQNGANWYDEYVKYAINNGIIKADAFDDYDRPVKRYEMAVIFSKAVPDDYLAAKNNVTEIPDVPNTNGYFDRLQLLYNAGVVMGNDDFGTFMPNNNIIRAEAAAIIGRIALPENRLQKTLTDANYDDAYYLVNQTTVWGLTGTATQYDTPWQLDDRNAAGLIVNSGSGINDLYKNGKVEVWRDLDDASRGLVGWDFYGKVASIEDGVYFKLTDDDQNEVVALTTKDGKFYFGGQDTGVKTQNGTLYFTVKLDLDAAKAVLYINGTRIGEFDAKKHTVSRVYIGSGEETIGSISVERCDIYKDYLVNDIFLVPEDGALAEWEVTGSGKVVKKGGETGSTDLNSAQLEKDSVAKMSFKPVSGSVVYEAYMLFPTADDTGYISLNSGDTSVAKLSLDANGVYAPDGTKLRHHTNNIWQTLRIEADTVNGTVLYKVNGKKVGEFALSAALPTVDNITIGATGGTVYFDDAKVFMTHDHDDYCPVPMPVNDDGYDVWMNICSLWHEGSHFGWGALSAFSDIEPALGYYDEGIPEVADWEIKFMVENGIDVQHYCWYTPSSNQTEPIKRSSLSYALHDGFFNAEYSDKIKFTFMWENSAVGSENLEQFKNYIWSYWMDYYFLDDRFYTIDNKLVFTAWNYQNFKKAFGGTDEATLEALRFMNDDAKAHGFDGVMLFFADGHAQDAATFTAMANIGASGAYAYHWGQDGNNYDASVARLQKNASYGVLHIIPAVSIGFNNVGWSGSRKPLISIDDHKKVLEYIKNDYLPKQDGWKAKTLIVSTWNEYGEGTYVMPCKGLHGFGYLENVAEVISGVTDHSSNIYPTDNQKARLCHMYPTSKTSIKRLGTETDETIDPKDKIQITIDKVDYKAPFNPILKNDELYVAASAFDGFFSLNNYYYEWSRYTGVLRIVTKKDHEVIFTVDSNTAKVDGKDVTLAEKFTLRDGLPVIPLFMLYKLDETNYTFENNTLTVSSLDKKFEEIAKDRVAYQYEFEVPGDLEGFVGYTTTAYVQNGFLSGDAVERVGDAVPYDPRLALTGISLDTLLCNKIVVGMKYELLDTDNTKIEVYYATDVDPALSQDKSALVVLNGQTSGGKVNEYVFDFSEKGSWTGKVTQIRVDPISCGGHFDIDYIRFVMDEKLAEKNAALIEENKRKEEERKKKEEERLSQGILLENGDAEDLTASNAFTTSKANGTIEIYEDKKMGNVWRVTPAEGKIWTYMGQVVQFTPGTKYNVSLDIKLTGTPTKASDVTTQIFCNVRYLDADGKIDHITFPGSNVTLNSNDDWKHWEFTFEIPENATSRSDDQFTFYSNPVGDEGVGYMIDNLIVKKA